MSKQHKPEILMVPIGGLYDLLSRIRNNQAEPLNFDPAWKKDELGTFFKTCVIRGVGRWVKPKLEVVSDDSK